LLHAKTHCEAMLQCALMFLLLALAHAKTDTNSLYPPKWSCLQCIAIQDAIRRSILQNITRQEKKGGEVQLEVADIIGDVCHSDAWKSSDYSKDVRKGCTARIREHHRTHTQFWGKKEPDRYKKPETTRWIGYSVCTQPKVNACEHFEIGFSEDVEPNRCSLCRAIVKDTYAITRMSKFAPDAEEHNDFLPLSKKLDKSCANLAQWRSIGHKNQEAVATECKIFYNDYKKALKKLLINQKADYARNFCNTEINVCQHELSRLPFSDDGKDYNEYKARREADEL